MDTLLKYSDNYCITSRSLCNYYRDEIDNLVDDDQRVRESNQPPPLRVLIFNVEITIPPIYLSNCWRLLELQLPLR